MEGQVPPRGVQGGRSTAEVFKQPAKDLKEAISAATKLPWGYIIHTSSWAMWTDDFSVHSSAILQEN